MFGYVTASAEMPEERRKRYRAYYCGLCRNLGRRYGAAGRMTLSYDAVFLYMLLSSLYEPEEQCGQERCLPHPMKEHEFVENPLADYAADVNLLLSYHKCMDDWQDEHRLSGRAEAGLLQKSFASIEARYPEKSAVLKRCLDEIHQVEKSGTLEPDRLANLTGEMLGTLSLAGGRMGGQSGKNRPVAGTVYLPDGRIRRSGRRPSPRAVQSAPGAFQTGGFRGTDPAKPDAGDGGMHPGI